MIDQCKKCGIKLWNNNKNYVLSFDIEISLSETLPMEDSDKVMWHDEQIEIAKELCDCSVPRKNKLKFTHITSIQNALESFFHPIILDGYYCSSCKGYQNCLQEFYIFDPPQFLVINLKRYNLFVMPPRVRNDAIANDFNLSLKNATIHRKDTESSCEYALRGLVEHMGSLTDGHYVSYVRHKRQ